MNIKKYNKNLFQKFFLLLRGLFPFVFVSIIDVNLFIRSPCMNNYIEKIIWKIPERSAQTISKFKIENQYTNKRQKKKNNIYTNWKE